MNYTNNKIVIALAGTTDWYAKIIQKALDQPINHALILYQDPVWGGIFAAEINAEGLSLIPFEIANKRFDFIEIWECSIDLLPGLTSTRLMIGSKYDWLGMLAGLFRILWWKVSGQIIEQPVHSVDRVFCSEYVSQVIKSAKVPMSEDLIPVDTSPGHLREWMEQNPYFFVSSLDECF